jgi:hypothetical protein
MRLVDKRGYVKVKHEGKLVWEHRLVWFNAHGYWPNVIDHIDGDKSNNTLSNLRDVSKGFNNYARGVRSDSTTGVKGVFKNGSGFMARISKDGQNHYLGTFRTKEEAQKVYEEKERKLYSLKALEKEYGQRH